MTMMLQISERKQNVGFNLPYYIDLTNTYCSPKEMENFDGH